MEGRANQLILAQIKKSKTRGYLCSMGQIKEGLWVRLDSEHYPGG